MCGIVGVAGDILAKEERAFTDLLLMNQLRGFDSVGVAKVVSNGRQPEVVKSTENVASFVTDAPYSLLLKGLASVLIGHNRAATVGTVTVENAHPFQHGHITGVHNGTLVSQFLLDSHKDFKVDSDNLFYHLCMHGVDDMWSKTYGAASFVWWDAREMSLNFLRNKERPMYLAFNKDRNLLIWGSEFHMVQAAAWRNAIPLVAAPISTEVNKLYTFYMEGWKRKDTIELKERVVQPYVPPVYNYRQLEWNGWGRNLDDDYVVEKRPAWLKVGQDIDVCFERREATQDGRAWLYYGYSPYNDKINITCRVANLAQCQINLENQSLVYSVAIASITPISINAEFEWQCSVFGATIKKQKDGTPTVLEDLLDEVIIPLNDGVVNCKALCTFEKAKNCAMCRKAFGKNKGYWTTQHKEAPFCEWCGTYHEAKDFAYVTKDHIESYCSSCFTTILEVLSKKDKEVV